MEEWYPDDKTGRYRKKGRSTWMLKLQVSLIFLFSMTDAAEIHAVSFELPSPPYLNGPLASNAVLAEAERNHEGKISSVPHSYVRFKEDIYAVTAAGQVINVTPCRPVIVANLAPRSCNGPKQCGHLVSIRLSSKEMLLVLDAYRGLFEVHPITGVTRQLYNSATIVNGRPSHYLSDVVELPDGRIVMSDASAIFDYASRFWIMFEGRADGRLIALNPVTGHVEEIMANLAYPSSLELTFDRTAFLVAEASRSRIYRVELDRNRAYYKTFFRENLPGMPEHIRQASKGENKGSYWVGLTYPRYQGDVSVLDQYSAQPAARNFLAKMRSEQQLKMMYNRRGLAVELSMEGHNIRSMHDPTSRRVAEVTEVIEHGGLAYVGTSRQSAVIRVVTSASRLSIDSMIQVMRSRCKVTEDKIPEAKEALRRQVLRRKSAAISNQKQSSVNTRSTASASIPQPEQVVRQPVSTEIKQQTGQHNQQHPASRTKSFTQGLSRIQKILNQRGLINKKPSTRTAVRNTQSSEPAQSPAQTNMNIQRVSQTPKYKQPLQSQSISQGLTRHQQQSKPQPLSQKSYDQTYKQPRAKLPVTSTYGNSGGTLPSSNEGRLQSQPSMPVVPPTSNDKMYPNHMRQQYQENIPTLRQLPIPPALHDHHMSGTGQVYAPNGNVPLPFSATGFQQNFADINSIPQPNPPQPNLSQMPGGYQDSGFGPYTNYKPVGNNAPTDPNSPFLPHGLVPTGHHHAVEQPTHYDGGTKPQIVHKVVNGQMISQILVPDIETILYDKMDFQTTVAPFIVPTHKPDVYKSEMFKPQEPVQPVPQIPIQNEKEKKLALGGFLGITPKPAVPVQKAPLFNLGPEMVNTFPEFGQMMSSALDASPLGLYGRASTSRPPTAANSNAALALSMFTGVNGSSEPEKLQPTSYDLTGPPSSQSQEQSHDALSHAPKEIRSPAAATRETFPIAPNELAVKTHQATGIQDMQMYHPGSEITSATFSHVSDNYSNIAGDKPDVERPGQSLLKRGLNHLAQLFREEEIGQTEALSTPTAASITGISPTSSLQTVVSSSTTDSTKTDALSTTENVGPQLLNERVQAITPQNVGSISKATSQQNPLFTPTDGTSLAASFSGAAAIYDRPQDKSVNHLGTESHSSNSGFAGTPPSPMHSGIKRNHDATQSDIHDSNQAQLPQQKPNDEIDLGYFPQSKVSTKQDNTQNSQQQLTPTSPSLSPQSEQLVTPGSVTQEQQTKNSHGFIQIYQDGKYIVIPLSPNMLQTLSSSLGAAITGSRPAPNA